MRSSLPWAVAVLVSLASSSLIALAGDDTEKKPEAAKEGEKDPKLPWNPFAKANEGDWSVFLVTSRSSSKKEPVTLAMIYRVTSVASDSVTISNSSRSTGDFQGKPGEQTFSTKKDLTLRAFVNAKTGREEFTDAKITEEKKTIGGKEFECVKLAYSARVVLKEGKPEDVVRTLKVATWISKEAKGQCIVFMTIDGKTTGGGRESEGTTQFEIKGYGRGDRVDWGKKLEEVELPKAAAEPKKDEKSPGEK
ncbi:hypothetical protein HY251_21980 [bacterium]|nr:hypothetical protein [bacterium]